MSPFFYLMEKHQPKRLVLLKVKPKSLSGLKPLLLYLETVSLGVTGRSQCPNEVQRFVASVMSLFLCSVSQTVCTLGCLYITD